MKRAISQDGFSTLEVIVSAMIFLIASAAVMSFLGVTARSLKNQKAIATRSRIMQNLVELAGMPAALRASTYVDSTNEPFNVYLKTCLMGDSSDGSPCYNANSNLNGAYSPFRLYLPTVEDSQPFQYKASGFLTGTPQYPMRFDESGFTCDTYTQKCPADVYPFEAFTEFLPICYPNFEGFWRGWPYDSQPWPNLKQGLAPVGTCWAARFIRVRLTIQPSSLSDPSGTKSSVADSFAPYTVIVDSDAALAHYARQ